MVRFKAKLTFAHGNDFYYPNNPDGYEKSDSIVTDWLNAGYIELIEEPQEAPGEPVAEPKPKAPKRKKAEGEGE